MAAQCCCCKAPGAEAAPARPPPEPPPALDVASASSAQLFRLRHLQLGLELRPEARELAGCLVLELCALRPAPRALVLDAHPALRLHSAAFRRAPAAAAAEPPCAFAFAAAGPGPAPPPPLPAFPEAPGAEPDCCPLAFRVDPFTDYGSSLTVTLPPELQAHQPFQVILRYTSTDAPAIWWLDPELTYGNAKPFVFTQGHSVCNRSFFPCFDTPAVKCTYSAVVKAPSGVQVLMSATQSTYVEEEGVYRFHMEHPVPAYLVALVAGDLQPADIGPRYDIVFLPPSFPIVAMENPCLTFIISSILESDEFLVIDVIHEVAHSWFGNAVTNATWEEMWLSEGLATYAQRRITTETYGAAFTCLETAFRLDALHRQMKLLGEDSPVSKLQVKLEPGVNPSHLMNLFTYEKGYCFVYYLSQLCGDPQRFDDFLRAYVEKYKFTSVVAQDLLDSFLSFFPELKEQSVDCRAGLEFERWLNATGPPLAEPDLSQGSSLTRPVEALFQLWTAEPLDQAAASASAIDISKWRTFQTALFLDRLLDGSPLPQEVVMRLSKCYSSLLDSMNAEIRIRWLQIVVRNDYYPDLHRVRRFLESQVWPPSPGPAPTASPSRPGIREDGWCPGGGGRHAASGLALGTHTRWEGRPCPPEVKAGSRVWRSRHTGSCARGQSSPRTVAAGVSEGPGLQPPRPAHLSPFTAPEPKLPGDEASAEGPQRWGLRGLRQCDRRPGWLGWQAGPGKARGHSVPTSPDVPHVHHPAVRGPLHRRPQVLRPGGVLPDPGPASPQPAQDHPADPVPGPGPWRRAQRGTRRCRSRLGGGPRSTGPAARGRGPRCRHFSQGRQRVCLALTSQTPRLCLL
uniref:Peptidase M1 leukotriene A4 hydrolase/aminopeptidase C-terminal domain-containing protein n=1 Tax=Felis catus TaxID=9685 RepID=A0ABI7XB19_FELCA